jgi:HB1, ASXL, restriction endonuclease HTH domain
VPDLDQALRSAQPAIREALAQAERELDILVSRRVELEALIARAKAALGDQVEPVQTRRTLHDALKLILSENNNEWMEVRDLTRIVNERTLYTKRDASPVEANQIHARTKNYDSIFEKSRSRVRLRTGVL